MIKRLFVFLIAAMVVCSVTSCGDDPDTSIGQVTGDGDDDGGGDGGDDDGGGDGPVDDSDSFSKIFAEENDTIMYDSSDYVMGQSFSRTIYIDSQAGDDANDGLSQSTPIKSLDQLATMGITNGDEILLKGSADPQYEYKGTIRLINIATNDQPIRIGSYGDCKARINAQGEFAAVLIQGTSNVTVSDVKISADGYPLGVYGTGDGVDRFPAGDCPTGSTKDLTGRYGVLIYAAKGTTIEDFTIYNVDIHDVFYFNFGDYEAHGYSAMSNRPCREWSTNGETDYGWGIRIYAAQSNAKVNNTKIDNCNIHDVSHTGIKSNNNGKVSKIHVTKTNLYDCGGPGAQFNNVNSGRMDYCKTIRPGSSKTNGVLDKRKWGRGSGMWLHTCNGFLFDHNYYYRSEGVADCCGAHMDIGNRNVIIQYCLSVDNCGGFVEVLGENYNCSYRYNISIDDGWRNIGDDAVQDGEIWGESVGTAGCIMTVNGLCSKSSYTGPYNTYIYNNTIISSERRYDGYTNPFVFELATSNRGLLVANNIFYVPEQFSLTSSEHSWKDGVFNEKAYDFKYGADPVKYYLNGSYPTKYFMTNDMVEECNINIINNLYKTYDESADMMKYPFAENVLPDNDNPNHPDNDAADDDTISEARYMDRAPKSGDPGFSRFVGGQNPESYLAECAIPSNASVINRGIVIEKLLTDDTSFGTSYHYSSDALPDDIELNRPTDFFGNPITTPIIGACVAK